MKHNRKIHKHSGTGDALCRFYNGLASIRESWSDVTCKKCFSLRSGENPNAMKNREPKPINLKILKIALEYDNYKMLEIGSLTVKAWRVLKRIRAIDSEFLPMTEHDVWRQSTRMGLDA